ncbi:NYN domain-containing protein [Candidatus Shapirobacteria bacterium]|nr:NYN domain-containing protein [Candidatus Shapirobacteria bacterium]
MDDPGVALFIDGENLRHYVEKVLLENGFKKYEYSILSVNFEKMFQQALKGLNITNKTYYSAKLQSIPETEVISKLLIEKQRFLKTKLEKQGYTFMISGTVRPQFVEKDGKKKIDFKEKGVDVRIAVDLIKAAVDKEYKTVVLCSSDSDLQPAIKEARNRGLEIVYLGFELQPNKGLTFTTNKTILLRGSEIVDAVDNTVQLSAFNIQK